MAAVLCVLRNLYLVPNHKGGLLNFLLEVLFCFSHSDNQPIEKSDHLFSRQSWVNITVPKVKIMESEETEDKRDSFMDGEVREGCLVEVTFEWIPKEVSRRVIRMLGDRGLWLEQLQRP